jgi:arylsulfatase A-like enzyme
VPSDPSTPRAPSTWAPTAAAWLGAAGVGALEVVDVGVCGAVAPGPVATVVLVALAAVWPGAVALLVGPAARSLGLTTSQAGALGALAGAALVAPWGGWRWFVVALFAAIALAIRRPIGAIVLAAAPIGLLPSWVGGAAPAVGPSLLIVTVGAARPEPAVWPEAARLGATGAVFEAASSPVAAEGPAVAALLGGQDPWVTGLLFDGDVVPADAPWLPAELAARGYRTAAFAASPPTSSSLGFDRGFTRFDDESGWLVGNHATAAGRLLPLGGGRRRADETVDRARRWIRRQQAPWFAWVHLPDPTWVLAPPPPYDERYADDEPRPPVGDVPPRYDAPTDGARLRADYLGTLAFVDAVVADAIEDLRREGALADAIIVVVGTHGVPLGEDGAWLAPAGVEGDWAVPLVLAGPGVATGVLGAPVETTDLAPTLRELLGFGAAERSWAAAFGDGRLRRSGARGVAWTRDGWAASTRSRHGRAVRGARASWQAVGRGPSDLSDAEAGDDGLAAADQLRVLLEGRASELLRAVEAAPVPARAPAAVESVLRRDGYVRRP